MGIAMMAVMHLYFNFTQPLFIQSLMTLKTVYDAKLVQIYVFGKEANGDFQRPFKTPSLFGGTSPLCLIPSYSELSTAASTGPRTDAAAIAEAEKRLSKKEE